MALEAMLADPDIDIIVNLAPPETRHPIGRRVLDAGKHLYCEKPLAICLEDADDLLAVAQSSGLLIGCAPDTFLGAGHQATQALVASGELGQVVSGSARFGSRGPEAWHLNPDSFYRRGGGPLLDVGPYYVTQLVTLLGPVTRVVAVGACPQATRTVPADGERPSREIAVEVPTTIAGALVFETGVIVSLSLSWDAGLSLAPPLELYYAQGAILAPDPNQFEGKPRFVRDGKHGDIEATALPRRLDTETLRRAVAKLAEGVDPVVGGPVGPDTAARFGDLRGLGLVDLASAVVEGRPARASAMLARHVLEVLLGLQAAVEGGGSVQIHSRAPAPAQFRTALE